MTSENILLKFLGLTRTEIQIIILHICHKQKN